MQQDDQFLTVRYTMDQWQPVVRSRELQMVKTGSWFFGLFGTYKMIYTDWEEP